MGVSERATGNAAATGQRAGSSIHPRLEPLGLDWVNFAVLRRSHSTLHEDRGTDAKIIADQQGHGLGVHLDRYVDSSVARKREAAVALWSDFKALALR